MQQFISLVAAPVLPPLLSTPPTKKKKGALLLFSPRRSGRIAIKKKAKLIADDPAVGMNKKKGNQRGEGAEGIQELIARVCGILAPGAAFDDASRAAHDVRRA